MNSFLVNWKTTAGGAATVLLGVLSLLGVKVAGQAPIDPQVAMGMITGGLALIFAKDANAPTIIKVLIVGFAAALFLPVASKAADNLPPIIKTPSVPFLSSAPCTPTSCTGFYVGGQIGGVGSNADIVGNGVTNSVFAGGGIPMVDVGYQYVQNNWLFGAEVAIGAQVSTKAQVAGVAGNENGLFAYQIFKVGGNLSALFGTQSAPIAVPPSLANALISPYLHMGAVERQFAQGWETGAGALFDIGPNSFIDLKYMYVNYGPAKNGAFALTSENIVTVGFDYKFK